MFLFCPAPKKAAGGTNIFLCDNSGTYCPITFLDAIHKVCWPLADPTAHPGDVGEELQKYREDRDHSDVASRW